mgnify:CR=1 FL=1|jgi:ribosome-associated heat shock protein Hsp15
MRIDKFLWCVRLYKTRSLSTSEVNAGKVRLNGEDPKPGKALKGGDLIQIRVQPIWRSYKVKGFPKSRVGAKLVAEYMQETTDENDLAELEMVRKLNSENRNVGIYGRPTKKHRRDLDDYLEP